MFLTSCLVAAAVFLVSMILIVSMRGQHFDQQVRLEKHRKDLASRQSTGEIDNVFAVRNSGYLADLLAEAGMESKYSIVKNQWIMAAIGTEVLLTAFAYFFARDLLILAAIFGLPLGAAGFIVYIKTLAKRRQAKLTEQLPHVLETMVSSLKAGLPIVEIFKTLAETAPEPIGHEFKRALVALQLGKSLREALGEMSTRIHSPDFKLLTQAIFISQDAGANLSGVVAIIADAIRERFKLRELLGSLTAQGKMTAMLIGALPYLITLYLYLIARSYMNPFFANPIARIIFGAMVLWELLGVWILMKLTTLEV